MKTKTEETNVQQVDVDIDEILGTSADNVMLPEGQEKPAEKRGIFSSVTPDTTFLDNPEPITPTPGEEPDLDAEGKPVEAKAPVTKQVVDEMFSPENMTADDDDDEPEKNKGGRPSAFITATKGLIEKGLLVPFVNDKGEDELNFESYKAEDFEELFKSNLEHKEQEISEMFYNQLPNELKTAYEYVASGGNDLKGLFNHLASSQEVVELDVTKEADQKKAIRNYLSATNYGTPEEIEDEIFALEDRGDLEKKAKQFKPKLDAMQQQILNKKLIAQKKEAQVKQQHAQKYMESVHSTLEKGELSGIKIDNKTQSMLYSGLLESNYPSISGKQTNMLGHLLEKHQWIEPRHDLIAEALWLLADPEAYHSSIKASSAEETNKETFRKLKTEEANKTISSSTDDDDGSDRTGRQRGKGISRPKKNFFGR